MTIPTPTPRSEDRLRLALRGLEAALDEQARAMLAFRANLSALGDAVGKLERGLHDYRGRLTECRLDLAELREQARRLEGAAASWNRPG
jgi:chromosome segregation ATPase